MQQMYIEFDKTFVDQPLGGQRDEQKEWWLNLVVVDYWLCVSFLMF
jgi:hypothetical protein